ncbi:MAG: phosphotransferase [Bacteroidia bacterium]|nr:phosphotransferase [Bacteroidia bacterium]
MSILLDAAQLPAIAAHLTHLKWIAPDESLLSATIPGQGNMNYTLRIRTSFRSFILKQSRPYVEKYPQIPAPKERVLIEGQFYDLIYPEEVLRTFIPAVSGIDPENSIMMLEDLGDATDYTYLYQRDKVLPPQDAAELVRFLSVLHTRYTRVQVEPPITNRGMRALNGEHIFRYPLMEANGFDLDQVTPGLQAVAMRFKTDSALKEKVASLEAVYQADGNTLLHGDYYPGSWLRTLEGVKVIDPEFCFLGPAEFDLAVMLAHLQMAGQPQSLLDLVINAYGRPAGFDADLLRHLVGVEIIRRLIGLAQLPLPQSLAEKESLLDSAYAMIMTA